MKTPSATIRSQNDTANLGNFEFIDFASLALAALAMTLQTAENLTNGIYQPLPPLPFDDTGKSALTEAFEDVSPVNNARLQLSSSST